MQASPCKLDLDDKVPHHSTFSVNRLGRFRESEILRHIFERVHGRGPCQGRGIRGGCERDGSQCQPLSRQRRIDYFKMSRSMRSRSFSRCRRAISAAWSADGSVACVVGRRVAAVGSRPAPRSSTHRRKTESRKPSSLALANEREFRQEMNAILFPKDPFIKFRVAADAYRNGLSVWIKMRNSDEDKVRELQQLVSASQQSFASARDEFLMWLSQRQEIIGQTRRALRS